MLFTSPLVAATTLGILGNIASRMPVSMLQGEDALRESAGSDRPEEVIKKLGTFDEELRVPLIKILALNPHLNPKQCDAVYQEALQFPEAKQIDALYYLAQHPKASGELIDKLYSHSKGLTREYDRTSIAELINARPQPNVSQASATAVKAPVLELA
jgi:hypothetical protein